ncbi:MAG TPA: DUF4279 domain-containing protein [Verrucomicrobiae bacterium]|jgi:hypothetical protein
MNKKKINQGGRTELRRALESVINPPTKKTEAVEPVYFFRFSATLRISGDGLDFEEISRTLGLTPTHTHQKGERRKHDMWLYKVPVPREQPLESHIMALWDAVRLHIPYLRDLKRKFQVDVFCGYRSNSGTAGFQVGHRCLGLFSKLEVPFGVSVIIS